MPEVDADHLADVRVCVCVCVTVPDAFGGGWAALCLLDAADVVLRNSSERPCTDTAAVAWWISSPYKYGWSLEIVVDGRGRTTTRKLFLLGRTNQEGP
jgi:hypothetical protein